MFWLPQFYSNVKERHRKYVTGLQPKIMKVCRLNTFLGFQFYIPEVKEVKQVTDKEDDIAAEAFQKLEAQLKTAEKKQKTVEKKNE